MGKISVSFGHPNAWTSFEVEETSALINPRDPTTRNMVLWLLETFGPLDRVLEQNGKSNFLHAN